MLTIYNRTTGEKITCEDKEQRRLMLGNENFVATEKEVEKQEENIRQPPRRRSTRS